MSKIFLILTLIGASTFCFSQSQIEKTSLYQLNGNTTSLEEAIDLERPTVIAFWATWCGPCLKELDAINLKLQEWKTEKEFNFVAITLDDQRALARVKPMAEGRDWEFDILADPNQDLARKMNVTLPPFSLIYQNGEIVFSKTGYKPGDEDVLFSQINTVEQRDKMLPKGLQIAIESNTSYYREDEVVEVAVDTNQLRTNTYIKADYDFLDNFRATAQLELYERQALLDYSSIYEGTDLGTYALNYNNGTIDATIGHFYDQWGTGLAFRAFEDRQLGLNTAVLGGRVNIQPIEQLSITGMAGKQRLGFDLADSFLYGGNLEYGILTNDDESLSVGGSLLFRTEDIAEDASMIHDEATSMISGRINYQKGNFNSSLEINRKSEEPLLDDVPQTQLLEDVLFPGNSVQLNLGYAKKRFGINGSFRRMEGMSFYSERFLQSDQFNQGVLNYIPALTKQQDYSLMNRYNYIPVSAVNFQFDFGDGINRAGEIGSQIDIFYQFAEGSALGGKHGTNVTLNLSRYYNIDADYDYDTRSYENAKLFGFGDKLYGDASLEIRKQFTDKHTQILTLFSQNENVNFLGVKSRVIAWEGLFQSGDTQSIRLEGQHKWADIEERNWWAATAEYSFSPALSVFASDMYNYGNLIEDLQYHNYNVGGSFTLGSTRADLMLGRRPSGLLCVGGVCRQVTAASGIHLNLTSTIR